jgi:hypothetical protein
MYLLPTKPNRKLGRLGYGYAPRLPFLQSRPSVQPQTILVRLAGVGYGYAPRLGDPSSSTDQSWRMSGLGLQPVNLPALGRMKRMRGLGRLGQPPVSSPDGCVYYGPDGVTVESIDTQSNSTECGVNGGRWYGTQPLNTPSLPAGAQNPSPVGGAGSNAGITTVIAGRPSTSPLDYTSPQAAIAAGLDPQTVYNAWSAALSRFPSPQAAISAGVPAGVVNQLWQQSHVNAAAAQSAPGIFGNISIGTVVLFAGGLFVLSALGGRRGR